MNSLTWTKVLGTEKRAQRVWRRVLSMLGPECDGDVLDGLNVVFSVDQKLDRGAGRDGLGGVEACDSCIGGCCEEREHGCDDGGGTHICNWMVISAKVVEDVELISAKIEGEVERSVAVWRPSLLLYSETARTLLILLEIATNQIWFLNRHEAILFFE